MGNNLMQALTLEKPFTLRYKEVAVPAVPEGWAQLKIRVISVCGSDIHAYRGNSLLLTYPRVLGHELCATVESLNGQSTSVQVGDKVSVIPILPCSKCFACRTGHENCCASLQVLGVHVDGGMSTYAAVPIENLVKVPASMDDKLAALMEPLSVSAHAVRRGGVCKEDKVLVIGAGPIGMGVAEVARTYGADVRIADTSADRRKFAMEQYGYREMNPLEESFMQQLREWTDGEMPNKVFDSTGNQKSMNSVINYLSNAGSLIFVGLQTGTVEFSDPEIHKREASIYTSRNAQRQDFEYILDCLLTGKIDASRFITNQTDFEHAAEDIGKWVEQGSRVFKGVVNIK